MPYEGLVQKACIVNILYLFLEPASVNKGVCLKSLVPVQRKLGSNPELIATGGMLITPEHLSHMTP